MIQPSIWAKCQQLVPVRSIFVAGKRVFCFHVLNATDKKICLVARSIVASATPVNIIEGEQTQQASNNMDDTQSAKLTVAEMRSELEQKGVSCADCLFKGPELDALIKMLL